MNRYQWHCSGCGTTEGQHERTVFCSTCINALPKCLPWPRYLAALRRFRDAIAQGGLELSGYDDNTTGCKSTEVTWGLCSHDPALWPDAQDHLWPHSFTTEGRSAPIYRDKGQHCPFDANRDDQEATPSGCFHRCAFFKSRKAPVPDKTEILARYDALIAKAHREPS
jgi:hypothetical protein